MRAVEHNARNKFALKWKLYNTPRLDEVPFSVSVWTQVQQ